MNSQSGHQPTLEDTISQLTTGNSLPAELMEVFAEEAEDHLQTIYDGLNRLKSDSTDETALADVRRASHTLKGAAGAVNLQAATRLAHRMEDLLDRLAERSKSVSELQLELLLATADQLQGLTASNFDVHEVAGRLMELYETYTQEMGIEDRPGDEAGPADETSPSTFPEFQTIHSLPDAAPESARNQFLRVPLNRLDELVGLLGEMMVNRSQFQQRLDDFESRIADMQSAMERLRNVAQSVEGQGAHQISSVQDRCELRFFKDRQQRFSKRKIGFDSLEFEQYDELSLLSQSLSEADNDAEMMSGEFRSVKKEFDTLLRRQQQLNRDAQKSLMRIRMVPLSGIVSRLERTVRTVSRKLDRAVELDVVGERIELDKTVLDEITDPVMHLIRNAIDHGIEPVDQRIAAGKPATARVGVEAVNQGTQVILRISDDGGGINLEKVRRKAIEQGLITENQELDREQLHGLIFRPGFSTAATLSDVSGRGVGMDVVGEAIRRLKGTIRVDSESGQGTTFTIQLPTTVGVTRAVFVESAGKTFAIPMQSIRQTLRLDPTAVSHDEQGYRVEIDGEKVRLIALSQHLQNAAEKDPSTMFERPLPMLVMANGKGAAQVAVTVDLIVGSQDVVVKSLGDHLKQVRGVVGATIGSDGGVVPILDSTDLIDADPIRLQPFSVYETSTARRVRRNLAMVVDDSISVRRVNQRLLKLAGWDVVAAKDGIDALEKLADLSSAPDVFLCDMEMPRMDGLELIRQLRDQPEFEMTPIVMVTSRASEKHRHKAFDVGATEYVVKPYNEEQLLDLITSLVMQSRETIAV